MRLSLRQNNALRNLTRQKNDSPQLIPGTVVDVTVTLRDPLDALVERMELTDAQYFTTDGAVTAADLKKDLIVTIKSMVMQYQSAYFDDCKEVEVLSRFPLYYVADVPYMR
jgi:hypothetical protein